MLCPSCGNDNPSGSTACAVCGTELRPAAVGVIDPTGPVGNERDPLEDSLWPPPTVFVFDGEDDVVLEVPSTSAALFEDAQADDVFEQSLSGQKLEDLIEEEETEEPIAIEETLPAPEPPQEIVSEEPAAPIDAGEPATPDEPAIPEEPPAPAKAPGPPPARVIETETLKPIQAEPPRPVAAAVPVSPEPAPWIEPSPLHDPQPAAVRNTRRGVLSALVVLLFTTGVFGVGAAAGFWYASTTAARVAAVEPVAPPVETKPAVPVPPDGMVYVPGGDFLMGSDDGDMLSRPAHFVSLRPFFIDRTEVTNEAYRRFVEATSYDAPATWKDGAFAPGAEEMPVTGVSWYDAAAYAAWAGKRLPTEAEWEFAARGADGRKYPWGSDWDASLANVDSNAKGLRRVGEGSTSPFGAFDMAGNAWEWTASDARPYPGSKEFPWSRLRLKIIRGGNWKSDRESSAATFRGYYGASGE